MHVMSVCDTHTINSKKATAPVAITTTPNSVTVIENAPPPDMNNSSLAASINGENHSSIVNDSDIAVANEELPASPTLKEPKSVPDNNSSSPANINNSDNHRDLATALTDSINGEDHTTGSIPNDSINEDDEELPDSPTLTTLPIPKESESLSVADNITSSSTNADINDSQIHCVPTANSTSHTSISFAGVSDEDCTTKPNTPSASPPASDVVMQDTASPTTSPATALDTDVVMQDSASPSSGSQKDENLPTWLSKMIDYLREVSDAPAWQDLVSGFIEFEKGGPPHGVSSFLLVFRAD